MNLQISTKLVPDLTAKEYRDCHRLNMRDGGCMQYTIESYRQRKSNNAACIMVHEGDLLVGWALINFSTEDTVNFYVRQKYRRQGIGTMLMKEVRKLVRVPRVEPWNKVSGDFFHNFLEDVHVPAYRATFLPGGSRYPQCARELDNAR